MRRVIVTQSQVSTEDVLNGKKVAEPEYVYYGRIDTATYDQLNTYPSEVHEQYAIQRPNGCIRVRRTKTKDTETFTQAVKEWTPGVFGNQEASLEITADIFEMFKRSLAETGFYKRRYFIDAGNGLKWEVDAILKRDGSFTEWVKIDLEVPVGYSEPIPELPVKLYDAITTQFNERTPEEAARLKTLQENIFDCMTNHDD